MQVEIEVITGPQAGRRVQLAPDEPLVVGRLPELGLPVPEDPTVSRRHCQFNFLPPDCFLSNLSSNGTLLNGREVTDARVSDGDEITVGERTTLKVLVVHGATTDTSKKEPETTTSPGRRTTPLRESLFDRCVTANCASGLVVHHDPAGRISPADAARELAELGTLYAIVDFSRLETPVPDDMGEPQYLFDWLPAEARRQTSPLILSAAKVPSLFELIEQAWGHDAVVCVASSRDAAGTLTHLRGMTGYSAAKPRKGIVGYCWPSVCDALLASQPAGAVEALLEGLVAVLLESPDDPKQWRLYTRPGGLGPPPAEPPIALVKIRK